MDNNVSCNKCVATKQMRESQCCTKNIVKQDNSFVPECFLKSKKVSQAEYNYLMCPTYNLGMYEMCNICPLDCIKNPNKQESSNAKQNTSVLDVISMLSGLFNVDNNKKQDMLKALNTLDTPEFQNVYKSIERSSAAIQNVMTGKNNNDINAKILKTEAAFLKSALDELVLDGKIDAEEVRIAKIEIDTLGNIQKLKTLLNTMKK